MAVQTNQIENGARDFLNAGLGLFQTVSARIDTIQKDILAGFNGLVSRGAADKSEVAQKLRGGLDQGLTVVRDVQSKLGFKPTQPIAVKPAVAGKTAK